MMMMMATTLNGYFFLLSLMYKSMVEWVSEIADIFLIQIYLERNIFFLNYWAY